MLLCDGPGCNQGCHMSCLSPQLTEVPDGDWICPSCLPPVKGELFSDCCGRMMRRWLRAGSGLQDLPASCQQAVSCRGAGWLWLAEDGVKAKSVRCMLLLLLLAN